jgi:hypothetical protein
MTVKRYAEVPKYTFEILTRACLDIIEAREDEDAKNAL